MSFKTQFLHFVKHDLKGVLKCLGVESDPPPPTDRDRQTP